MALIAPGIHLKYYNEPTHPLLGMLELITPSLSRNAILNFFIEKKYLGLCFQEYLF